MSRPIEPEYVKVVVLDSSIEAQLTVSILSERSIPYQMCSYHDTAYGGLFQVQRGWGEIRAPQSYERKINAIVGEIRAGSTAGGEMA